MKEYQNPEVLEELYCEKEMTTQEIADELGVSLITISRWKNKHNISRQKKYRNPDVLKKLYHEQKMTTKEIGDKFGVKRSTIRKWMKRHNISTQKEYQDPEVLEELYHRQKLSLPKIADKFGVSNSTIHRWMNKHNISTRKPPSEKPPHYGKGTRGYMKWFHTHKEERYQIPIHRLLAVSEFGFEAVKDMDVHHKNGCRFDNRPENIELLNRSEHAKLHRQKERERKERRTIRG